MKLVIVLIIVFLLLLFLYLRSPAENFVGEIPNNDTITLYYAPWCGHSVQFMPIWEKFRERNKNKIIINTINCDEQKCPAIPGFPTIVLNKYLGQKEIYFDKERTVENLEQFISN